MKRLILMAAGLTIVSVLAACSPVNNGDSTPSPTPEEQSFSQLWDELVSQAQLTQISGYEIAMQDGTRVVSATVMEGTTLTTHRLVAGNKVSSAVNQGPATAVGPTWAADQVDVLVEESRLAINGCQNPAVRFTTTILGSAVSYQSCDMKPVPNSMQVNGQQIPASFDPTVRESWDDLVAYLAVLAPQQLKIGHASGVLTSIGVPTAQLADGSSCNAVLSVGVPGSDLAPYSVSCAQDTPSGAGQPFSLAGYDLDAIYGMVAKATNNEPGALATVTITSGDGTKITVSMTSNNGTDPVTQTFDPK